MACASCHPDGREDALTWGTIDGPRQTPMLAARLDDTGPYSWNGVHSTVEIHLKDTIQRLRGTGLRESEVHAIAQYIKVMDSPKQKQSYTPTQAQQIQSGKELFFSADTACATCHQPDKGYTDGIAHDVGSVSVLRNPNDPKEKMLDTPSLKFIRGTAPFFHDGRYSSLQDMLDSPEHAMGYSMNLTREQRVALAAFLETL
jgi:mono/diheme cytochrome c family protein